VIDVAHHISTVERRVGRRTLPAGEARTVTIARVYPTSPEDLWDACTNAERLSRWFLPVSGDLRLGGRYAFAGNASGTIERCEPPRIVAATWEYGGQTSWIELTLTPEPGGGSRFSLDHIAHVDDEIWAQFGPGAVGVGWDGGVLGLTLHLGDGEPPSRAAIDAWVASAEGRAFNRRSSEAWGEADIAAGTDPGEARAAATRTADAYTAEPST
jgi:uncharacterized protein YndB with AHSA1/START domain